MEHDWISHCDGESEQVIPCQGLPLVLHGSNSGLVKFHMEPARVFFPLPVGSTSGVVESFQSKILMRQRGSHSRQSNGRQTLQKQKHRVGGGCVVVIYSD